MTTHTVSSTHAKIRFGEMLDNAIRGIAVIVERHSRPLAVLVDYNEYTRLKGLEAALIAESRRIAEDNGANDSLTSGEELKKIMAEYGVEVD